MKNILCPVCGANNQNVFFRGKDILHNVPGEFTLSKCDCGMVYVNPQPDNNELQKLMFKTLGFTDDEAEKQFGFLMNAFKFGAPPHGGIAFGLDRLVSIIAGLDSIRDVIAFPKNNSGRDVMIDSPSEISQEQLNELNITVKKTEN